MYNAIILCGGQASRMGDLDIPKNLIPLAGRSLLERQLDMLLELDSVNEIVLSAGHLASELVSYVDALDHPLASKIWVLAEEKKLGTGGAIKFAMDNVRDKDLNFIVFNGDIVTEESLKAFCAYFTGELLILGAEVPDGSTLGTLEVDGDKLVAFKEKTGLCVPALINGGIYLFKEDLRGYMPQSDCFSIEYDVFEHVENARVLRSKAPWFAVDTPERLDVAQTYFNMV